LRVGLRIRVGYRRRFGKNGYRIRPIRPFGAAGTIRTKSRPLRDRLGRRFLRIRAIGSRDVIGSAVRALVAAVVVGGFLAGLFQYLHSLPFEIFAVACVGNDSLGLSDFLGAPVTELVADISRELTCPLHGHCAEITVHSPWAQRLVPVGIHTWRDNLEFVTTEMGAEAAATAAEIGVLVHAKAVNGERPADPVANVPVSGATDEDTTRVESVVSDVPAAAEE
jgi:hypothetical protein